jgi:hypothetical protein
MSRCRHTNFASHLRRRFVLLSCFGRHPDTTTTSNYQSTQQAPTEVAADIWAAVHKVLPEATWSPVSRASSRDDYFLHRGVVAPEFETETGVFPQVASDRELRAATVPAGRSTTMNSKRRLRQEGLHCHCHSLQCFRRCCLHQLGKEPTRAYTHRRSRSCEKRSRTPHLEYGGSWLQPAQSKY